MSDSERKDLERYYLAYRRGAVVCLLASAAGIGYFLAIVSGVLSGRPVFYVAWIVMALFAALFLAVPLVTLRGRILRRSDPDLQRVLRDEWNRRSWNRACRSGFAVVMWAQLPLMYFMSLLASEPSFSGMAGLSMSLGMGAFWATYLYVGQQQGDG